MKTKTKGNQELDVIEEKRIKLEDEFKSSATRLDEITVRRTALAGELAEAFAEEILGAKDGKAATIQKQLDELDQEEKEFRLRLDGLQAVRSRIEFQERSVRLGVHILRVHEVAPLKKKAYERYLSLRQEVMQISRELNELDREETKSRMSIYELRRSLGIPDDMSDLPEPTRLSWNDSSIGISVEQLQGRRPW